MMKNSLSKTIKINVIFIFLSVLNVGKSIPEVKTEYGTFIGHVLKSRNGRDVYAYEGIPFAKPPVGNLRFQEPQPLEKSNRTYNATKVGSNCFQENLINLISADLAANAPTHLGSEDCLYLNIYVPKIAKDTGNLSVMFYIHGGGYIVGSGGPDWSGPTYFLDKDIIVVSINYRLSILGFLNVDELFNNLGMKDQNMALKWVNENIEAFGGDPDSITISGISAGSSSVILHMHSPLSKGLFKRGLGQSGTFYCDWALRSKTEARKVAYKIVDYLGCSKDPKRLIRCLQKMPVLELFKAISSLKESKIGFFMPVGPVVEMESPNAFITEKSILEESDIPLLSGVTREEGLTIYNMMLQDDPSFADDLAPMKNSFRVLLPKMAYYAETPAADEITTKLVNYYIGDEGFSNKSLPQFIKILSDALFNYGQHTYARKHKGTHYQYLNNYEKIRLSSGRPPTMERSMSHGEDASFLYTMTVFPSEPLTGQDLEFSYFLVDLWTNFIRFGNPTPDSKLWKISDDGSQYLELSNGGSHSMKSNMFKNRMEFLNSIFSSSFKNKLKNI